MRIFCDPKQDFLILAEEFYSEKFLKFTIIFNFYYVDQKKPRKSVLKAFAFSLV